MDEIDRHISDLVQRNGRASSAEIAGAVGVSVSTANERVRRLAASGVIRAWRGVLDPDRVGAGLCSFMLVDVSYEGEEAVKAALSACPEVQEMHHVSGAHSYLLKVRLTDTHALQAFLQDKVKPLNGVERTETILVLETIKETTEVLIGGGAVDGEKR
ncbi:MAG: Lrp/AsnC family transcriptional regulator [Alphaproteobacteria bacterium]|nr:Lrp/AsnC family transcriptional regulator [Alphaproteobacteria bacterium]